MLSLWVLQAIGVQIMLLEQQIGANDLNETNTPLYDCVMGVVNVDNHELPFLYSLCLFDSAMYKPSLESSRF